MPGFYALPLDERAKIAAKFGQLNTQQAGDLSSLGALSAELADIFIENAVGAFSLPLGVATNFKINNIDVLVPMAVEESSVVAAASHGAKLARAGGGFFTASSEPIMTGQIQLKIPAAGEFEATLASKKDELIAFVNRGHPRLSERGGGAKDMSWYYIPEIESLIIMLHVHTCDAMGANIVNTMAEKIATQLVRLFSDCELGLRILTNLTPRRSAKARCSVPSKAFTNQTLKGDDVVNRIVEAYQFAWHDPYRAATHNKGVMNGIDPVVIATGNDWRAVEAGAHAHCALAGQYRPMTRWRKDTKGDLEGSIEIPMAVGTVGGVTKLHPSAQVALNLLGNPSANRLGEILCAVGLAQNLSALRALATEGIQRGHMSLHTKNMKLRYGSSQRQLH